MKFWLCFLAVIAWQSAEASYKYSYYNNDDGGGNDGAQASSSSYSSSSSSSYTYNGDAYGTNFFVDTDVSYYDGYQQAWRYLGWYVKCGAPSDRYDEEHSHSGSQDQDDFFKGNNWCQRYLIWAAYIDENYQNGGIGEYQYYDPYSQSWDDSACDIHGNGRCAPMDCHLPNTTTWKLMGVFKEASYFGNDAFFEQLFKHEGICVWNDEDLYEFMSDARESAWPQGCVNTGLTIQNKYYSNGGYYLYLDIKPMWNGNMTYGLYTDENCYNDYEGTDVTPEKVAQTLGLLYGESLETWNDGMEAYKVCQPCMAYNLKNTYKNNPTYAYSDGGENNYYYYNDVNYGYFQCWDDANYINVNQCMKFRTHAELEVATWEDLVTATNQGGILTVNVSGTIFGSDRMSDDQLSYMKKQRQREVDRYAEELREYDLLMEEQKAAKRDARGWVVAGVVLCALGAGLMTRAMLLMRDNRRNGLSGIASSTPLRETLLDSSTGTSGGTMA